MSDLEKALHDINRGLEEIAVIFARVADEIRKDSAELIKIQKEA